MNHNIELLLIKKTNTVREAMVAITRAGREGLPVGIILVVDSARRLCGTVTDGDIRKALVSGVSMDAYVIDIMSRDPITVQTGLDVDNMIKTVRAKAIASGRIRDTKVDKVVVTDEENCVVDVIDFSELWYKQEIWRREVCVIGVGHVGLTLAVVLADLGFHVAGVDVRDEYIGSLKEGRAGFYEKGLEPLLRFHLKRNNLKFTTKICDVDANVFIIAVGTPVDGQTNKANNDFIKKAALDLGKVLKKEDLVIMRSTVTVGTTRNAVLPILEKESGLQAGKDFYLVFAPERVVEGNAIEEIKTIPQIVGGINRRSVQEATGILQTISPSVIILDSLEAAEMVKLINNTYRDYSFAFANKVALLCEELGLDSVKLIKAASEGYSRNPVPLPSPGVGGYCLTKDPYLMAEVATNNNQDPAIFLQSRKINDEMPQFIAKKISSFLVKNNGKTKEIKVYIVGFAFKGYPETSDMRGSPAVDVLNLLSAKFDGQLDLYGYDPVIKPRALERINVKFAAFKEGFVDAHAVLIMNNHPDFMKMDIYNLVDSMRKPSIFFDGWQIFSPQEIAKIVGVSYQGLGGQH